MTYPMQPDFLVAKSELKQLAFINWFARYGEEGGRERRGNTHIKNFIITVSSPYYTIQKSPWPHPTAATLMYT